MKYSKLLLSRGSVKRRNKKSISLVIPSSRFQEIAELYAKEVWGMDVLRDGTESGKGIYPL
jgi:hypothetical protein